MNTTSMEVGGVHGHAVLEVTQWVQVDRLELECPQHFPTASMLLTLVALRTLSKESL